MTVRKLRFHVLLVGIFGLLSSVGTASGQTVLVTAKSVTELTDDLESLIKSVAPEANTMAQAALNGLSQLRSGAMLKGLDRSRGFGLAVTLPKDFPQGGPPSVVAAVPVTDLGQFLDSLKDLGVAVDDQPGIAGFSHKVTAPNGNPTLFVLQSKGYALFSLVPDGADQLKVLDPSSWKPKGRPETAFSIKIQLAEIPDALKDQFLNQVEVNVDQQNERKPGEADAEYQGRIAAQKLSLHAFKSLIQDGDEIALDLDLNRKASEIALELGMRARPNTSMAKTLRSMQGRRSRFQGLDKDAAMAAWANFPVSKVLRDWISEGVEKALKEGLKKVDSKEDEKLFARFGELVKSNLTAPEIDLGLAVQVPSATSPNTSHIVILSGMRVQDGREFERLVREAAAKIKPGENVKLTFDVTKAADGTPIHQVSGPVDDKNAEMAKRFGKASLFFAFRQDAILASFGENGLEPLRRAIERSSDAPAAGSTEPISMVIHLASLGAFAEKNEEEFRRAISDVFRGDGAKRDRVYLGLKGEDDGIRLRLAIDVPALKMMTMIGNRTKP
jgi:hypothetical protein